MPGVRRYIGSEWYWAICPVCAAPVRIAGHYRRIAGEGRGVGTWKRAPERSTAAGKGSRKKKFEGLPRSILGLAGGEFDRVVEAAGMEIGVRISAGLAREMLRGWLAAEGYMYTGAHWMNVPQMVLYTSGPQTLVGQSIDTDGELARNIRSRVSGVEVAADGRIGAAGDCAIDMVFTDHRQYVKDGLLVETMRFTVLDRARAIVHEEKIRFDHGRFEKLVEDSSGGPQRNRELLAIAREEISAHGRRTGRWPEAVQ